MKEKNVKIIDEDIKHIYPAFNNELLSMLNWGVEPTPQEINFFFGIIGLLQDIGKNIIEIDYQLARSLAGRNEKERNTITFNFIEKSLKKYSNFIIDQETKKAIELFEISIVRKNKTYRIRIKDEDASYLVSNLDKSNGFTRISLETLIEMNLSASKKMYIHLSQYINLGIINFPMSRIRDIMGTQGNDKLSDKSFITKRLKPAIEELNSCPNPTFSVKMKEKLNRINKPTNIIFSIHKKRRLPKYTEHYFLSDRIFLIKKEDLRKNRVKYDVVEVITI